jgi:hypothetical protein
VTANRHLLAALTKFSKRSLCQNEQPLTILKAVAREAITYFPAQDSRQTVDTAHGLTYGAKCHNITNMMK